MGSATTRRDVRAGDVAAVIGGAALLAGSWVVVVTATTTIPDRRGPRSSRRHNGRPIPLWPFVWAPVQMGSLVGSLLVVATTAVVTRKPAHGSDAARGPGRVLGGQGREAPRVARRPVEVAGARGASANGPPGSGTCRGHSAVAFALATVVVSSETRAPWRVVPPSRSPPPSASAGCTQASTCRSTSSASSGLGLLTGITSRWALGFGGAGCRPDTAERLPIAR